MNMPHAIDISISFIGVDYPLSFSWYFDTMIGDTYIPIISSTFIYVVNDFFHKFTMLSISIKISAFEQITQIYVNVIHTHTHTTRTMFITFDLHLIGIDEMFFYYYFYYSISFLDERSKKKYG